MGETGQHTVGNANIDLGNPWLFFGVAYALTWSFWLVALVLGLRFDSLGGILLLIAGLAGPGIAGVGFTYLVYDERGRSDFWTRLTDVRRIGLPWVLVILFLTLAVNLGAALIDVLLGGLGATWSQGVQGFAANPLTLLPTVFFATLPPLLEELGWRGYVLDRLQLRRSALEASLIVGVAWSVWHLPLFFIAGSYQQGLGVGTVEFWLFIVGIVPLSVAFSWVYNNTSRSILAVILLHSMVNITSEIIEVTPGADAISVGLWIVLGVGIVAIWGAATLTSADEVPRPPPDKL